MIAWGLAAQTLTSCVVIPYCTNIYQITIKSCKEGQLTRCLTAYAMNKVTASCARPLRRLPFSATMICKAVMHLREGSLFHYLLVHGTVEQQ